MLAAADAASLSLSDIPAPTGTNWIDVAKCKNEEIEVQQR
jgi:hypothetical protein